MKVGGLFSGIGGFELGLVRAGFEIAWMVEKDEFCQKILKKHAAQYWPGAKLYGDIKEINGQELEAVELVCGGFPCQPFSNAGKRGGKADDRYLWPEMVRLLREVRPRWVLGENVGGLISMELEAMLLDLEAEGYRVEPPFVLPACAVGAPHHRDRVWIVAHTSSIGLQRGKFWMQEDSQQRNIEIDVLSSLSLLRWQKNDLPKPYVIGSDDGFSRRLDRPKQRIKALGNAVVPQIPEILGRCIIELDKILFPQE